MSVIVRDEELKGKGDAVLEAIQRRVNPDEIKMVPGLAMVATVGQGMNHHVGVAARLTGALAKAGVNIRVIDQGSSEMNIIIGVEDGDLKAAIQAIYETFDTWS
jgi:aspartate kinase